MDSSEMRVLDLFSGIAGFHLGLAPFGFKTVGFCDIDKRARRVLRARMRDGRLPEVPIHEDVRSISLREGEVDAIVGGFPCSDVSRIGPRTGINSNPSSAPERSDLLHEVVRLTREAKPSIVFMENVQNIVNMTNFDELIGLFRECGYAVRWATSRASDFGAPHQRHRWWCLCVRRDAPDLVLSAPHGVPMYDWRVENEPPRTLQVVRPVEDRSRIFTLGNALVPCVASRMLVNLWTASTDVSIGKTGTRWPLDRTVDGAMVLTKEQHPPRNLVLDPDAYTSPLPPSHQLTHPILTEKRIISHWATPRATSYGPSNYITVRSKRDLATQVRFEQGTTSNRRARVSPEFVEFLMGFPIGWTTSTEGSDAPEPVDRATRSIPLPVCSPPVVGSVDAVNHE